MRQGLKSKLALGMVALHVSAQSASPAPGDVVHGVQAGLEFRELEALRQELDLSMDRLTANLGLSRATLHRRKAAGRLSSAESDKIVRFARLLGQAVKTFGGVDDARLWLKTPQRGLGGAVPLDYAQTEAGAREVEKLLGRIDYGVYS